MKHNTLKYTKTLALLVVIFLGTQGTLFAQSELQSLQKTTRNIVKEVLPSVVTLDTRSTVTVPTRPSFNFFFDPFGNNKEENEEPRKKEYNQEGLGSGIIVRKVKDTYYVLTNAHVVDGVDEVTVITAVNEFEFKATIIGLDDARDLALVSFESTDDFPVADLGDSDSLQQGDIVFAIGNPYGFRSSITFGIVSALDRDMVLSSRKSRLSLTKYIQTDAAVNRGNSGGPLVNIDGEVIGINTWIYSSSGGGNEGLSFAVPINNAKNAIISLIEKGSVDYGWLGARIESIEAYDKEMLSLSATQGILISGVYNQSPANRAGLLPGDIVTAVNGEVISTRDDLISKITTIQPGEKAVLDIVREDKKMSIDVILAKRVEDENINKIRIWPGFSTLDITSSLKKRLDLTNNNGVVVSFVDPNSAAATAEIREGDVIERINGKKIKNLKEFYQELNNVQKNEEVIFRLIRNKTDLVIGIVNN